MKRILLLLGLFTFGIALNAQEVACEPDLSLADSVRGVSPLPLDPETGIGGIEMFPACIGEPYELVVSFKIGDSASVQGFDVDLLRAEIATVGAVEGLPEGINYFCNPPDCVFPDSIIGCIVLRGTPSAGNAIDTNKLVIAASLFVDIVGEYKTTIPGPEFPGEYNIVVRNEGECSSVSTNDFLATNITLANIPNPVIDQTTIEVSAAISGAFQFQVHDVAGRLIHNERIQLTEGYNNFNYDASRLEPGMYIYSISSELGAVAQKMIVGGR